MAKKYVNYRVGGIPEKKDENEEDEDEISDDLQTFTDNKALDDLRNYSKDKSTQKRNSTPFNRFKNQI